MDAKEDRACQIINAKRLREMACRDAKTKRSPPRRQSRAFLAANDEHGRCGAFKRWSLRQAHTCDQRLESERELELVLQDA